MQGAASVLDVPQNDTHKANEGYDRIHIVTNGRGAFTVFSELSGLSREDLPLPIRRKWLGYFVYERGEWSKGRWKAWGKYFALTISWLSLRSLLRSLPVSSQHLFTSPRPTLPLSEIHEAFKLQCPRRQSHHWCLVL